jgi:hypothetical protein
MHMQETSEIRALTTAEVDAVSGAAAFGSEHGWGPLDGIIFGAALGGLVLGFLDWLFD